MTVPPASRRQCRWSRPVLPGSGCRALHDTIVAALPRSPLVATEDYRDDLWWIKADPRKSGELLFGLRFDAVVAPGGERLNGPGRELDLIASKVRTACAGLLGTGWCSTGSTLKLDYLSQLEFIRWRLSRGFPTISSLTPDAFDLFCSSLCSKGREGLVPVTARVAAYVSEIEDGIRVLPTRGRRGQKVIWEDIAHHVGVDQAASLPPAAKALINALVPAEAPGPRDDVQKEPGKRKPLTTGRLAGLISNWQRIWELRGRMKFDALDFYPFEATTPNVLAAAHGTPPERTPDLPPLHACFLLERAMRYVHEYSQDILSWLEKATEAAFSSGTRVDHGRIAAAIAAASAGGPSQPLAPGVSGAHWPMDPVYARTAWSSGTTGTGAPPLRTLAYKLLPAACFLVFASFTLKRKQDLLGIHSGSLSTDVDGPWINIYASKGHREFRRIPAVRSVVRALEIMRLLSAAARPGDVQRTVWRFRELSGKGYVFNFCADSIEAFASHVGLPQLPDGSAWHFASHQLRRCGIQAYYFRYEYAELVVVSEIADHSNLSETAHYLTTNIPGAYGRIADQANAARLRRDGKEGTDPEREREARVFVEVELEFIMHCISLAASGEVPLEGPGGKFITAELKALRKAADKGTIMSTGGSHGGKILSDALKEWVDGLRLHPHAPYSSCKCGAGKVDLAQAECLKRKEADLGDGAAAGDILPDRAYADVHACGACAHGVRRPENVAAIRRMRDEELVVAERGPSAHIRELSRINAARLARLLPGADIGARRGRRG